MRDAIQRAWVSAVGLTMISTNLFAQVFTTTQAEAAFTSDAPLELIQARSQSVRGALNIETHTFAFVVPISSFEGFNSALQRDHFNEKFLESDRYPEANFQGKIIEKPELNQVGNYSLRAKGVLTIHGVASERIIRSEVQVTDQGINIQAQFSVLLEDHNIAIPKVVYQKIAEEIQVSLQASLRPRAD